MINLNEKIYEWVDDKVGAQIETEIDEKFNTKQKLNVSSYAQGLVDKVFSEFELRELKSKLLAEQEFESDFSVAEDDIIDGDVLNLSTLSLHDVRSGPAETAVKNLLNSIEYLSPDEIIGQVDWVSTRVALLDLLLNCKNGKTAIVVLKIIKRLLTHSNSPKTVCEGFQLLAESVVAQIEEINNHVNTVEAEELYDIRDNKAYKRSSERRRVEDAVDALRLEVVTRSMYLLVSAHDNMPAVWLRFNERRLQDIIFTFIHTLAVSFSVERRNLSAFDLVTVLQPRGTWCRHWCHTALGRTLLSQAFRKNRRFFNTLVSTVIQNILPVLNKKLQRSSSTDISTPSTPTSENDSILGFPDQRIRNGRFCHCFSILTSIIQYRAGRTLFPLQVPTRRRPWSVQDIVGLMVDYVGFVRKNHSLFSPCFVHHVIALGRILLEVEAEISTARGTQTLLSRRSFY